jgi:hypothetical protein
MFCILIATPPPDDDEDAAVEEPLELDPLLVELLFELPQPATASAATAQSAGRIRLMLITTPPRVDPS